MRAVNWRAATLNTAEHLGLWALAQRLGEPDRQRLYVLTYHRVAEPNHRPDLDPDVLSATPAVFDAHMRFIASHYQPVSAVEVLESLAGGRPLPRNAVLVTVDDGYRDFGEHIFPIAQRYGIQPVLFLATAYAEGGSFWWDRLYRSVQRTRLAGLHSPVGWLPLSSPTDRALALRRLRAHVKRAPFTEAQTAVEAVCATLDPEPPPPEPATLDWEALRTLVRAGATIANHTHTHPVLSHIPVEQARAEVRLAQALLQRELSQAWPLFAFPNGQRGAFDEATVDVLRAEGFTLAFTSVEARAHLQRDARLSLPRLSAKPYPGLGALHLRLTPFYDWLKRRKKAR